MKIIKAKDYNDLSRKAANIISAQIIMKPNCVLGLATGSTPIGTYKQLVEWYEKGDLDFSEVTTVNLDEYKGLPRENDQSYCRMEPLRTASRRAVSTMRLFILSAVWICSCLVLDTMATSDLMSRASHLRQRHIA